ncbi:Uncharacterized conserved protein YndB, AHSA1/START domain [Fodinibius roseus]|uniref:Uncharacterized conserved protein YndB, AHSA1/START domain n=1 Tax=Fodinibius roseus TaxID=1194090 RepID=A0A1M5ES38_9BACT|nr:SRPBCC domain-containing protein [Fodinibius roseus]SHF81832.1 Uncharacterized conserved protein YndB, AHSA1/START domain [Fodinibius roseus]
MKYIVLCILVLITINAKSQPDMLSDKILEKERVIDAEITQLWNVLTNPSHIGQWLGIKTESEWKKGSPILFKFSWNEKDFIDKGVILAFEENKKFSYSYWSSLSGLPDVEENYSKITFDLQPDGNSTKLLLTHTHFATETMYEHSDKNWEESLDTIKQLAESGK